jgi:hypothetical protein
MIPHEKTLVKRLKNKPFALIGINSDGDRSVVNKILKEQSISWRQGVDGSTDGPLAKKWNVTYWPTIYVIDAKGVIRYKDVREKAMDDAVDTLIKEVKPTATGSKKTTTTGAKKKTTTKKKKTKH